MYSLAQAAYRSLRSCGNRSRQPVTLMMLGIDKAGKSTVISALKDEGWVDVTETVGFVKTEVRMRHFDVTLYDLGGGPRIRSIWPRYYSEVHGVVFVVDASDRDRIGEARTVLHEALMHPYIAGKPANKQDERDKTVMSLIELQELLGFPDLCKLGYVEGDTLLLQPSVARRHRKLHRPLSLGFSWLLSSIFEDPERYAALSTRMQADMAKQQEFDREEQKQKAERVRQRRLEREREEQAALAQKQEGAAERVHPFDAQAQPHFGPVAPSEAAPPPTERPEIVDDHGADGEPKPRKRKHKHKHKHGDETSSEEKPRHRKHKKNQVAPMLEALAPEAAMPT